MPDRYHPAYVALMAAFIFLSSYGITTSVLQDLYGESAKPVQIQR
jgi:hypothetical protein